MKKFGGSVHDDLTTDKDLPCDLARRESGTAVAEAGQVVEAQSRLTSATIRLAVFEH